MDPFLSDLHPNPGWTQAEKINNIESSEKVSFQNVGRHCILELYECDQAKLNDEAFVRTTITSSAKIAGATLINLMTHSFKPQGVTGLALLAESHISIHTWPEIAYAAIDVFTCGNHTMPENACEFFSKEFAAKKSSLKNIAREIPTGFQTLLRDP